MKIVVELKLVDEDDGSVKVHHEAFVPLDSPQAMSLVRQWTCEKLCSIRAEAIELTEPAKDG